MSTRLLLLIAAAGGLAVYFAVRPAPATNGAPLPPVDDNFLPIWRRPLEGEEPPDPAEFDVTVEVDTSSGKNRLYFNITERHGYYAEALTLRFWYSGNGQYPDQADSPVSRSYYLGTYVPAKGVLRTCFELVTPEIELGGGDIGVTGDWSAQIDKYIRARVDNPQEFPVVEASTCD